MVRCAASAQVGIPQKQPPGEHVCTFMKRLHESGWQVLLRHCSPAAVRQAIPAFDSEMYEKLWKELWGSMSAAAVERGIDALIQVTFVWLRN
jgi:hypothetical protein